MKKLLFSVAVLATSLMGNAQIVKISSETCNYLDIQADASVLTTQTVGPGTATATNGSIFTGVSSSSWNTKSKYDTTIPIVGFAGVDSLTVGTMFRGYKDSKIALGAFTTTTVGKITAWFQPNGDSNRGVSISVNGIVVASKSESGVKLGANRPGYAVEYTLPVGSYAAGDVVVTVIDNTTNVFGIGIEGLSGAGFNPTTGEPCKATGWFNLLGQKLNAAPEKGAYIETYSDCPATKIVK